MVFFAVGFETTAPANALAVAQARQEGLRNFSVLVSHVRVPPALEAILASPKRRVDAFLAAGHVCSIMGTEEYLPLAAQHRVPIVVTAFEPVDLLQGILMAVSQLEEGRAEVENQYTRLVKAGGNRPAQALIQEVFQVVPRTWRGIGEIPRSGFGLREEYAGFDAAARFGVGGLGGIRPPECPAFGQGCTPDHPLGATMVSSEGACAAYYRYRRFEGAQGRTGEGNAPPPH